MINRLLGIIYVLMKNETVKAADLAERFEVSVRTIYRDVDTLSMAGIPAYARKGKNGGISLTSQFILNKMMVSKEDQRQILAALRSMEETGAQEGKITLQKLEDFFDLEPENWVAIDFSDWSQHRRDLFNAVRQAILQHRLIEFDYYGQQGEMKHRIVEPVQLLFKEYTWYLRAYCRERKAMRLFKIYRMKRLTVTDKEFIPDGEKYREQKEFWENRWDGSGKLAEIKLLIAGTEAYRVYDRFEEEEITVQEDGSFLICMRCMLDEWVYGLILSFGEKAQVLEPKYVKEEIGKRLLMMIEKYIKF